MTRSNKEDAKIQKIACKRRGGEGYIWRIGSSIMRRICMLRLLQFLVLEQTQKSCCSSKISSGL